MYFVGIDISKYKHDCCILSNTSQDIIAQFSFTNDATGFKEFFKYLDSLSSSEQIRIGFEATAHYTMNLKLALEKANYSFMETNPVLISKFIKAHSLRKTKTDPIDCLSIAKWLMTVGYKPHPVKFYHTYSLKSLTRLRDSLVHQRSFYLVKITNVLDHIFPEFKPFFNNRLGSTAIFILKNFNSANDITSIPDSFYDELHNISHGKFSLIKFNKLKTLASNSIGESNHYLSTQLLSLINLYTNIDSQIDNLDQQISTSIKELNPKYLSIPGVGELSAAIIYSEYGDLSKFDSPAQMLSFAGLEPGYFQSGTSSFTGHMVKHGSSHLRYTLMNLSYPLMLYNPCFAKYYQKKRNEGKPHRVACSHLVKKFLRVIFTLEKKNLTFDKSLLV